MLSALAPLRFDDVSPLSTGVAATMPVRTCVGCRRRDERSVLLRVVVTTAEPDGPTSQGGAEPGPLQVRPDPRRRLPGRGAWLHPSQKCLEQAIRRRAFSRALRVTAPLDLGPLAEFVSRATEDTAPTTPAAAGTTTEGGFDADEHPMSTRQ